MKVFSVTAEAPLTHAVHVMKVRSLTVVTALPAIKSQSQSMVMRCDADVLQNCLGCTDI